MINKVVLVGEIQDQEVRYASTTRNETMAYFFLRTWHRWYDPAHKRHATKSERHLVVTVRNDLVDVIRRRTSTAGLVYIEGALSSITDLSPGADPSRETAAIVVHRDGQIRFLGPDTVDVAALDSTEV